MLKNRINFLRADTQQAAIVITKSTVQAICLGLCYMALGAFGAFWGTFICDAVLNFKG